MKTKILDIEGKEKGLIELPKVFDKKIREDIVSKVLEAKKRMQPYSPSPVAGKQHSAKGKIVHRRHVWRSGYGRGQSRVPRKLFSQRGAQFNWEAAEVPHAKGGMRAHPPKVVSIINQKKINKKELKIAFESALSSTANGYLISKKYLSLNNKKIDNVPFVVESKILNLKTKQFIESIQKIIGNELFKIAIKVKKIRSGKGKSRGRKYKSNSGLIFVFGKNEKIKNKSFEVVSSNELNVSHLAKGGLGRLTIYTENAIKDIKEMFEKDKSERNKK